MIENAVILAAGLGSRLRPLTDEVPKCLTEINGKPLLLHALEALGRHGVKRAAVVIGYLGDIIKANVGDAHAGVQVEYVENVRYAETGTARSASLASSYLEAGAYLIEGDTIFDPALLGQGAPRPTWFVDRFADGATGSQLGADDDGRIVSHRMMRDRGEAAPDSTLKSCGVLRIPADYGKQFCAWLAEAGDADYYDDVIARHLDVPIYAESANGHPWVEIDDAEDLRAAEARFAPHKYIVVIIDGGADDAQAELGGRTPFEAAKMPGLDGIASSGRVGMVRTMYPGLPLGSVVAIMGLLGYNPARYYPHGRASFEALAQGIALKDGELAFRCNIVKAEGGKLADFTAGNISTEDAARLIERVEVPAGMRLVVGQGYRHLLIVENAGCGPSDILCPEPHHNVGGLMPLLYPEPDNIAGMDLAGRLGTLLDGAAPIVPYDLAPWSPSSKPSLPSFHRRTGLDATIITAMHFLKGIAIAAHIEAPTVTGATGDSDTDLDAKLNTALSALEYTDLVVIHVNGPDEEAHRRSVAGKVGFIERIDRELVQPLKEALDDEYPSRYRLAMLPDHVTRCADGRHGGENVPFAVCGAGIDKRGGVVHFSERIIAEASRTVLKSYEFLRFFIAP
jgi:2,3-bisphosphoglycerate-independent phosphoglycerate mutase